MIFAVLAIAACGLARAAEIEFPTTGGREAAVTSATTAQAQPTSATAVPHFDIWADQPRLGFCLPAIRSWKVVRHVYAQTKVPAGSKGAIGSPQIIFAQRPAENPGLSKYSVVFQASDRDPSDRDTWYSVAAAFYVIFLDQVRKGGTFSKVEASSPTVTTTGELHRAYFTYRLEKKSGGQVGGAVLCLPVRRGVLFYNLTLEGQGGEAVEAAMSELRRRATEGLMMSTWSAKPYVIGALLVLPLVVMGVMIFRRRRKVA